MIFRARHFEFRFPRPALIMGVVNVTPDSFSDGGQFLDPIAAVEHGVALVKEGADVLDIGGESTRPGAEPVPEAEELRRVIPVLEGLKSLVTVPISIDTRKPAVARAALAAGASIVNDVAANREDPEMWRVVAEAGAGYVVMHMRGEPRTMQQEPRYDDVVREVGEFFRSRLDRLGMEGLSRENTVLDVGIGFGKGLRHNLELLAALGSFTKLERPLLLGVSRKSFLGKSLKAEMGERLPPGLACAAWGVAAGVHMIRTHDVRPTSQAVRMIEAILAHRKA